MFPSKINITRVSLFKRFFWFVYLNVSISMLASASELTPLAIAEIQRDAGAEYAVKGIQAENPALAWRLSFHIDGVNIVQTKAVVEKPLKLRLSRIGNARKLHDLTAVKPLITGNRARYQRKNVEEWYVNGPLGLEQGFNVPEPMGKELVMELDTSWVAESQGENIQLVAGDNHWFLGALYAVDSAGQTLPSTMSVVNGRVRLEVETQNAQFPVMIDPILTRKATLIANDQTRFLGFGRSVAISGDGNTAIVGSDGNAAYIFKRTTTGWTQVQKLVKPSTLRCNSNNPAWFGWSVALSKDGSTAMVGASGIFTLYIGGFIPVPVFHSCGDLPVYRKQGTKWVLEKILTSPSVTVEDMFGSSVSLSQDGNRAIVGAQLTKCTANTDRCGAAYFFERGTSGWTSPKRFVNATTYDASQGYFGATTAISADGLWALVGAPGGDTAWAFQRIAAPTGWKQIQAIKFPATRLTKDFGTAMALSAVGDKAVITAESTTNIADCKGDYNDCGAAYSFVRQGTKWTLQSIFTAKDSHSYNYFGESLAMSANGNRVIVGTSSADCINGNCGAAYLFDRVGTSWIQQGRVTGPSAGLGGTDLGGDFGGAVSIAQGGVNFLVAARRDNCVAGQECGKVYHYTIEP
jgi:FG-GAP repeat